MHVDATIVKPGKSVVLHNADTVKYTIDGSDRDDRPAGDTYYRPTSRELKVVSALDDGEPGNPEWGRLVGMLVYHTGISVGEARRMRCDEIVGILGRGDPRRLREAERTRQEKYATTTAQIAAAMETCSRRARELTEARIPVFDTLNEPDQDADAPVCKPDGWTKAELIDQVTKTANLSAATFDRIRTAAGLPPAQRGGKGAHRRYSRSDLRMLITAVERGSFRNSAAIVAAWRELLDPLSCG